MKKRVQFIAQVAIQELKNRMGPRSHLEAEYSARLTLHSKVTLRCKVTRNIWFDVLHSGDQTHE